MLVGSIILAGGRSRRMGKPKESLPFLDTTLLGRAVETLLQCSWPVIVLGRDADQDLPPLPLEAEIRFDQTPDQGPLAAMATGMGHVLDAGDLSIDDAVLVIGCDMPFFGQEALAWLTDQLGGHDAVMVRLDGVLQPLGAVYRLRCLEPARALLGADVRTPRTLAERVDCRILEREDVMTFDPDLRFLHSVDTPDDYERALKAARPAG